MKGSVAFHIILYVLMSLSDQSVNKVYVMFCSVLCFLDLYLSERAI